MNHGTRPLIIAHRGASADAPENTLAAFRAAVELGADGIEFDVHLARDGVPVIIHDDNLKRTGARGDRVADLTSTQLGNIDVGSWFNAKHPRRAASIFTNERVRTLAEALDLLAGFDGLIYTELKCGLANFQPLVAAVCETIRNSPLLARIIVKSFCLAAIPEIGRLLPAVQTAALFEPSIRTTLRRRNHIVAMARESGAHQLSLHRFLATPNLIASAAEAGMPLTVWTVDDPKWIARSRRLNIGALITNDPAKLLAARVA